MPPISFCASVAAKFVSHTEILQKHVRVPDMPKRVNLLKTGNRKFLLDASLKTSCSANMV